MNTNKYLRATALLIQASAIAILASCIEDQPQSAAVTDTSALPDTANITAPLYEEFAMDTIGVGERLAAVDADTAYQQISENAAETPLTGFPLEISRRGSSALQIQILLDRAHFSPGIIDGTWGANAARALAFFRNPTEGDSSASKVDTTDIVDEATYKRLVSAGGTEEFLTRYTLSSEDVAGPFVQIPGKVYDQAKLSCLCYSSALEAIAERFHTSKKLLAQLNPEISLDSLTAGVSILVPNVEERDTAAAPSRPPGSAAKLVVSKTGFWTHVVDSAGTILQHFPSTLGAGYDPSPTGGFQITGVARNPTFHYQPKLFAEVPDTKPEARLPPGPNSPVGVVWMGLSKPHYGIHGTSTPETIGYANSHGCVRLTNWDALRLARMVRKGTPVLFQ